MPNQDHVSELMLYAVNTESVYRFAQDVLANLARHKKRGKYDAEKALISWRRVADFAAQEYTREHCPNQFRTSYGPFSPADRQAVAYELQEYYDEELQGLSDCA